MTMQSRSFAVIALLSAGFGGAHLGCHDVVDGNVIDYRKVAGSACTHDLDCGAGRHCDGAICAIDCVLPADCGPSLTCSACGRCVASGGRDDGCLPVTNRTCTSDGDCTASIGAGWSCGSDKTCARGCKVDDDCADLGLGYSCASGLCTRTCFADQTCWVHGFGYRCQLPAGVDPSANFEADAPVSGTCIADASGISFPAPAATDPPSAQLAGVWGFLVSSAAQTKNVPILTQLNTTQVSYWLMRFSRQGAGVKVDQRLCADTLVNFNVDDSPYTDLFTVSLPNRAVLSVRSLSFSMPSIPALTAGTTFDAPELIDLRGARLKDPANDPLPTYKDLATQWDEDHDGHPGMTKSVTGVLSGNLFQAERWKPTLHVTVFDVDHWGGLVTGPIDQTVLGSDNKQLVNDSYTIAHPQSDRTYFRGVRMPANASCADLVRLSKAPGGWLYWFRHYDPNGKPGALPTVDPALQ